jgi:hypothetical protein
MPNRPSEEEKAVYVKNQNAFRARTGDHVKIFRKADSFENGWDTTWEPGMDNAINRIGIIQKVADREAAGILIEVPGVHRSDGRFDRCFFYPYTCLEIIR